MSHSSLSIPSAGPPKPVGKRKAARRANRADVIGLVPDPLLTVEETAATLGVAVSTLWKHVKRGNLPAPLYPLPRSPRWRMSDLRTVMAPRETKAA